LKKILITGNSGYIGSHLSNLLNPDYDVYGLDFNDPQVSISKHYSEDIRGKIVIHKEFDVVVHLAALVKVNESELNPIAYYDTNLNGTLSVLKQVTTKNFIFASTGAAVECESAYGVSKRAAEDCVKQYCKNNNIDYTIFRFYNVIGSKGIKPTNPDGLFFNLMKAMTTNKFTLYGNDYDTPDGTCVRDYVHVLEICDAIKTAIETPSNGLENLGHGVGYTVQQIADIFKFVNNTDFIIEYGPRRPGDIESSVLESPSSYMKKLFTLNELLNVS
jgi:UDP-glucose 4-epimerase